MILFFVLSYYSRREKKRIVTNIDKREEGETIRTFRKKKKKSRHRHENEKKRRTIHGFE